MAGRRSKVGKFAAGVATAGLVTWSAFTLPKAASLAANPQDPNQPPVRRVILTSPPGEGRPAQDDLLPPPVESDGDSSELRSPRSDRNIGRGRLDPTQDVEEFVARTRKEATERIAALDKEAAELKVRLAKVEAASARMKLAFSGLRNPPEVLKGEGQPIIVPGPDRDPALEPIPQAVPPPAIPKSEN